MASAPVMNPSSRPKHNPVMMMSAVTGLMAGTGAKIKRPATVNAVMTMIGMMSRARRRSASKLAKNGTRATTAHALVIKAAFGTCSHAQINMTMGNATSTAGSMARMKRPNLQRHEHRRLDGSHEAPELAHSRPLVLDSATHGRSLRSHRTKRQCQLWSRTLRACRAQCAPSVWSRTGCPRRSRARLGCT